MSILTTKHLGKIYEGKVPYTALSDINFSIEKGEFVAIMGPYHCVVCSADRSLFYY